MLFFFSIFVYVKKPVGFFFRRITTYGRDSPPLRKADDTPISGACEQAHAKARSRLLQLRPWTPWIWGILNFRSIRVKYSEGVRLDHKALGSRDRFQ